MLCVRRSSPPDSRSGGGSRCVIPNLCVRSHEDYVENGKGEPEKAWSAHVDCSAETVTLRVLQIIFLMLVRPAGEGNTWDVFRGQKLGLQWNAL